MPTVAQELSSRRAARREIAALAVPVSVESMAQLVLQFLTQVIVGILGTTAIAAVGLANSLTFVLLITVGAFGASAGILVARQYGAGRSAGVDRTIAVVLMLAATVSCSLAVTVSCAATPILRLTGASPAVVATGASYLRVSALAVVPGVLCLVLSASMRSLGRPRRPLVATLAAVFVNAVLALLLITGPGPIPALGTVGAAWATLTATLIKFIVMWVQLYGPGKVATWSYPRRWYADVGLLRPVVVLALPLGITQLVWSTGTFLYNVVAAQLGEDALAAAQIVSTLEAVFIVGSLGLTSATTALVGRAIGGGDALAAQQWVHRVVRAGRWTGSAFGLAFISSSLLLGILFSDVEADVRTLATIGIVINGLFQIAKVHNMIVGAGVLPSGDDTRGVILGDTVSAFAVGLPLALVLTMATPIGVIGVFVARVAEELVKMTIFSWRARRVAWIGLVERP